MRIESNTHVTLDYSLFDEDGDLIDSSDGDEGAPIQYVHGYGMIVPGLELALVGLGVGDEKEVVVPSEAGFGDYDDELVMAVAREEFPQPDKVAVGDEFVAESADGEQVPMRVVELRDDAVIVDANHPLSGMTLHYKVRVRAIRAATDHEIEAAAKELDEVEEALLAMEPRPEGAPDVTSLLKPKNLPN